MSFHLSIHTAKFVLVDNYIARSLIKGEIRYSEILPFSFVQIP